MAHDPVDICIITTIHSPFDARIYERELASLLESGFSVCLVSPWEKPDRPWMEHEWVTLASPKRRIDRLLHGVRTFLAACRQPARAYHFHDIDFLLFAVLLHRLKRVPVVYDCHENYPEEILFNRDWIPGWMRPALSRVTRSFENWAVRRLRHCVVVVPHQVERFSSLGVSPVLVRNFAMWRARRDLTHEPALICTASLSLPYGAHVLLEIGRELRRRGIEIPLIVVDRFYTGEIRETFDRAIRTEKLNVRVHPKVRPKDMDQLLSRASIGLSVEQDLPNMGLGYHAKLFEYMAMGLPVVASDLRSNRKLVEDAGCGILVRADDAEAYVDAIERLLGNAATMEEFRENGFRAIERMYSWELEKVRLVGLYSGLLGGRSPDTDRSRCTSLS